jgi:hypothetical protein
LPVTASSSLLFDGDDGDFAPVVMAEVAVFAVNFSAVMVAAMVVLLL